MNPQGQMQFWFNGQPFQGVQRSGNDGGQMQFWFNGFPYSWLYPPDVVAPSGDGEEYIIITS